MSGAYATSLSGPYFMSKGSVRSMVPAVKDIHNMYGVVMHEAQMIDGRMALNSLFTASVDGFCKGLRGAGLVNYMEFKDFEKKDGKIVGAKVFDRIKGKEFTVHAKCVVNCAGVHADELRLQDNANAKKRIAGSRGTHIVFKKGLLPEDTGIIIPKTRDGRLLFICNYLGHPMVGTTDEKCEVTHTVKPTQQEIDFICSELEPYFGKEYDFKNNIQSAFAGIRPLCRQLPPTPEE